MNMPTRQQAVLIKKEGVPGTAEAIVAADGAFYQENIAFTPDVEKFPRKPYRRSLGTVPSLVGAHKGGLSFDSELIGSGSLSTPPPLDSVLRGCAMARSSIDVLAIGTITSGTTQFAIDETVTGGTSGATGLACIVTVTGDSELFVHTVAGGPFINGEVITGAVGAAAAPLSAGPVSPGGYMYRPESTTLEYMTVEHHNGIIGSSNALINRLTYALGTVGFKFVSSNRVIVTSNFMGRWDKREAAYIDPAAPPNLNTPQFRGSGSFALIGGYDACIENFSVELGNELGIAICPNDSTGLQDTRVKERAVTGSADPELVLPTTHDFFQNLYDNVAGVITARVGTAAGNRATIQCPRTQYADVGQGDRDGSQTADLTLEMHETGALGDDEFVLIMH